MKCPLCDEEVSVIYVRKSANGNRRRYQCAHGHRFSTCEEIDMHTLDSLSEYENDDLAKIISQTPNSS